MAEIKESLEVLDFAIAALHDAAEAKEGGLSAFEIVKLAISNAPAAVKAAMGADQIVVEMKDLDSEEAKLVADKGIELAKAVMAFFAAV